MPLPSAELSSAVRVLLGSWLNDQIDDGLAYGARGNSSVGTISMTR